MGVDNAPTRDYKVRQRWRFHVPEQARAGVRVLDLPRRRGGGAGKLLANLGADVVLVEAQGGSLLRRQGPFKGGKAHPDGSIAFAAYHTNKRGIQLDLESEQGQAALRDLAKNADVLIEDY